MTNTRVFLVGSLLLLLVAAVPRTAAAAKPKTLTSAILIVRSGDRATCTALNASPKNADLTVELVESNVPVSSPQSCTANPPGGFCYQQVTFAAGADHLVNCVVTTTTKNVVCVRRIASPLTAAGGTDGAPTGSVG